MMMYQKKNELLSRKERLSQVRELRIVKTNELTGFCLSHLFRDGWSVEKLDDSVYTVLYR